jgi:multiple antibiotic resistance protein
MNSARARGSRIGRWRVSTTGVWRFANVMLRDAMPDYRSSAAFLRRMLKAGHQGIAILSDRFENVIASRPTMTADLRQIVEGVLLVFAALFPIVNPLGGAPIFLAMTSDYTAAERALLAWRVTVNAFVLLVASVATGTYVLEFFGLSVPVVQVGGGLVVSTLGWRLLQDPSAIDRPAHTTAPGSRNLAFYPLTMPLTVGPGSISVAITIGANHPDSVRSLLINGPAILIGVTLVAATVFVAYRYADRLSRMIGETGMTVLLRLSAFILLCIGVQIVWNGASALLRTLPP